MHDRDDFDPTGFWQVEKQAVGEAVKHFPADTFTQIPA
jgi:hypothetical protein